MKKIGRRITILAQACLLIFACVAARADDWQPVSVLRGHSKWISALAFAPGTPLGEQSLVATASADNTIKLWFPRSGEPVRTLEGHTASPLGLAFSPDGKMLVSFANISRVDDNKKEIKSAEIKSWDVASGQSQTLDWEGSSLKSVMFAPDGKTLIVAGYQVVEKKPEYVLQTRDAATGAVLKTQVEKTPWAISPDNRIAAGVFDIGTKNEKGYANFAAAFQDLQTKSVTVLADKIPHDPKTFAFSPDEKIFVTAGNPDYGNPASFSKTLAVWDVSSGALLETLPAGNPDSGDLVGGIAFSPDGQWLATLSGGAVQFWDRRNGDLVLSLPPPGKTRYARGPIFSPSGKLLAAALSDNTVALWDMTALRAPGAPALPDPLDIPFSPASPGLRVLRGPAQRPTAVAWSPDGKFVVTAGGSTLNFWDVQKGALLRSRAGAGAIKTMKFSPDGKRLATGGNDNSVRLWDVPAATLLGTLGYHDWPVNGIAFSPDGQLLASGSGRIGKTLGAVRLWDMATQKPLTTLTETSNRVQTVAFSRDGKWLVSGNYDGALEAWNIAKVLAAPAIIEPSFTDATRMAPPRYSGHPDFRLEGKFSGDSSGVIGLDFVSAQTLAALDNNGAVRIAQLDGKAFKLISEAGGVAMRDPQNAPHALAVSPDGSTLALAFGGYEPNQPGAIQLWDVKTNTPVKDPKIKELKIAAGPVADVAWSPDGKFLASVGGDGALRIWQLK
jgi:WD40 repeat protein